MVQIVVSKGRHAGAQVFLDPGSHRLGAALDCDIVLTDERVSDHALTFHVDGDSVTATVFQDGVLVHKNGGWEPVVVGTALDLQRPADLLQVGTAMIACLTAEARLKDQLKKPDLHAESEGVGRPSLAVRGWMSAIIAVMVLFVGAGVILANVDRSAPHLSANSMVSEVIDDLGLGRHLTIEGGAGLDEPVLISGFVGREEDLAALEQALPTGLVDLNVVTRNDIERVLSSIAAESRYGVQLVPTDDGSLRLEGVVAGSRERDELRVTIRRAFPQIMRFDMRVVTLGEIAESLAAELSEAGLLGPITVQQRRDGLVLQGSITEQQAPALRDVQRRLGQRYGNFVGLTLDLEQEVPSDPLEDLAAVRFGDDPHLIMRGGEHVRPGDLVGDDWRVESIAGDGIKLERSGERRILEF